MPRLEGETLMWDHCDGATANPSVLSAKGQPFAADGGIKLLKGNLGRAIMKVSALDASRRRIAASARIFTDVDALKAAFNRGELGGDFVAVVLFQGPAANGMPELHALTPILGALQKCGQKVALLTDGRMSGASGSFPAAIHVTPEAMRGGPLAKLREGDRIVIDADAGILQAEVTEAEWRNRAPLAYNGANITHGVGRELFANARASVSAAEEGASFILRGESDEP